MPRLSRALRVWCCLVATIFILFLSLLHSSTMLDVVGLGLGMLALLSLFLVGREFVELAREKGIS